MGVSKTNYHIKIKIKTQKHSQEPPASSKAPNEDLKNMDNGSINLFQGRNPTLACASQS